MPLTPSEEINPARAIHRKPVDWALVLAAVLLLLGGGLRSFDLTDQPIDFHPTRQLRGMIIARGMYYQMLPSADQATRQQTSAFWASTGQYEPSILERLTAISYLAAGRELPWMARVINTFLWLIGGAALFDLARRMSARSLAREAKSVLTHATTIGALVVLAYYLILPFSVQASRSFQPDPGMVVWISLSAWGAFRWSEHPGWKWALLSGAFSGMAVLTKAVAFFTIAGLLICLVLYTFWKAQGKPLLGAIKAALLDIQVWSMALITVLPTGLYYLGRGGRASEYFSSWTAALLHLLIEPATYLRWLNLIQGLLTPVALLAALLGVILAQGRSRFLLAGLWLGYFAYGLFLPYQMTSHSYYHLQLVPITALSIGTAAQSLGSWLLTRARIWQWSAATLSLIVLAYGAWQAVVPLYAQNYRNEPAYWQEIASHLPADGKIIALTQDYGYRLMYYGWRKVVLWPNRGEIKLSVLRGSEKDFEDYFAKHVEGISYFLVTAFNQFKDQPALKDTLYQHYPILAETDGYIIFDLTHPGQTGMMSSEQDANPECQPFR